MLACLVCSTRAGVVDDDPDDEDGPPGNFDDAKSVVSTSTSSTSTTTSKRQQQQRDRRNSSNTGSIRIRPFAFQLKQMASRITAGALYRTCRPGCIQVNKHDMHSGNDPAVHPSSDEMHDAPDTLDNPEPHAVEANSPGSSLKSYKIDAMEHANIDQVHRRRGPDPSTPDRAAAAVNAEAKRTPVRNKRPPQRARSRNDLSESGSPYASPSPVVVKGVDSEWVAQVEPGVYITFHLSPDGFNDLKRIKFRRNMYSKEQAERWWTQNCNMVRQVYNVRPPSAVPADDDRTSSGYATPEPYSSSDVSKSPCY
ncbi:hypothetical protein R1sor_002634 [Riccia sorocarpa]|uniref:BRX domain-containing protein n=1 Tax=Riccia sorocarpa TaxID=122646 RepID=A0ABD3H1Z8_9MARC